MAFGLTPAGFNQKPRDVILDEINNDQLRDIDPALDVQPTDPIGVVNGIVADAAAQNWEVLAELYDGMDPDVAQDDQLDGIALITGTQRHDAEPTVVTATVNVDAGFHADPFTMIANIVGRADLLFYNKEAVDNPGGTPVDIDTVFQAVDPGPTQALAGTLTQINAPLSGWNSITNAADGTIGSPIETNAKLRARREAELTLGGSGTASAIRADILERLPKTTACRVLHNEGDLTDADGLPPHSVEAIARLPGATADDDVALCQLLLEEVSAGINTYSGNGTSKVVRDSEGNEEQIFYTRPTDVPLYIEITVTVDPAKFPTDGVAQVKQALVDFAADNYDPGDDVYVKRLADSVFQRVLSGSVSGVAGVLDWTTFKIDTSNPPTNTANFPIGIRQIAALSTSRIAVTVVNV